MTDSTLDLNVCTIDLTARTADFTLHNAEGHRVVDIAGILDVLGNDLHIALKAGAGKAGNPLSKESCDYQLLTDELIDPVDGDLSIHFDTTQTAWEPSRSVIVYVADQRYRADVTSSVLGTDDNGQLTITDKITHLAIDSDSAVSTARAADSAATVISDDELLLDLWIELVARLRCVADMSSMD